MEDDYTLTESDARIFSDIVDKYHISAIEPTVTPIFSALEIALMSGLKETRRFLGRAIIDLFTTED
jgi:hypothetical protein